ncbi:hypothetical protein AVEN_116624-1 [Araneus ventricosus]|uniref:Uncharacterized protein n=1 Tax=Araneus ventricosus TaxID=182803 RepID=A0A4Y2DDW1_ARAVE|nr:hypothetical protein AVEN_116624-1 [Araneus ventricosus]
MSPLLLSKHQDHIAGRITENRDSNLKPSGTEEKTFITKPILKLWKLYFFLLTVNIVAKNVMSLSCLTRPYVWKEFYEHGAGIFISSKDGRDVWLRILLDVVSESGHLLQQPGGGSQLQKEFYAGTVSNHQKGRTTHVILLEGAEALLSKALVDLSLLALRDDMPETGVDGDSGFRMRFQLKHDGLVFCESEILYTIVQTFTTLAERENQAKTARWLFKKTIK